MNAIFATPQTTTTISMTCPWCDEPMAVDDAFAATAVRCSSCATRIDIAPTATVASTSPMEIAA